MPENENVVPWTIFTLNEKLFALPSNNVQAIIQMPKVHGLPNTPPEIRGMINYRDKVYRLTDLRKLMGFSSIQNEVKDFSDLMDAREQDHRNWLSELEASVNEGRAFGLTTDPHKCKFGLWYDNFTTDNMFIKDLLQKFDVPHKMIHSVGKKVTQLAADGKIDEAIKIIDETRDSELSTMITLFSEIKIAYEKSIRELAIILENENGRCACSVDSVQSVEHLTDANVDASEKEFSLVNSNLDYSLAETSDKRLVIRLSDIQLITGNKNEVAESV